MIYMKNGGTNNLMNDLFKRGYLLGFFTSSLIIYYSVNDNLAIELCNWEDLIRFNWMYKSYLKIILKYGRK